MSPLGCSPRRFPLVVGLLRGEDVEQLVLHPVEQASILSLTPPTADLADRGIDVRQADFDDPASLDAAFAGVRRLLVISTDGPDDIRIQQHANAVDAAARAGVEYLAYTSVIDAPTSPLQLARPHLETERRIRSTGSRSPSCATGCITSTTPTSCSRRWTTGP